MIKRWVVAPPVSEEFQKQYPEINPVILQLLYNRGFTTQSAIDEFLNPDYGQDLHDPFSFRQMEVAVERIIAAIQKGEQIVVHGDYDADGVSGSVLLITVFEALGVAAEVYLPHREREGYGLSLKTIKELAAKGTKLVITVDCGISNKKEIEVAKDLGLDVIVTDHHQPPEILPDCPKINPKLPGENYPFRELTGVGVAFKLAQALIGRWRKINSAGAAELPEGFEKWLLDLVAIGTITDCAPLLGENRTLVKYGLIVLNKTRRLGLRQLIKQAGLIKEEERLRKRMDLNTYNIGFQIGPRLNAAGRINHASQAYELLMTAKEEEAEELALALEQTNLERQKLTEKMVREVEKQIKSQASDLILFGLGKDWLAGLVGLVAGRITEKYHRPSVVMTEAQGRIVGSGRSLPEFNITKALQKLEQFLDRFGGHSQACGFTLKSEVDLEKFQTEFKKIAKEELGARDLTPIFTIDAKLNLKEINWDLFRELERFEPFGEANPKPLFLVEGARVEEIRTVGKDNKHLKMKLTQSVGQTKKSIDVIAFCFADPEFTGTDWCEVVKPGSLIDLICEVNKNEWNGYQELQLEMLDLRLGGVND